MKIVLISCTKRKREGKWKAEELYSPSDRFRKSLKCAKSNNPGKIFILSDKYGLLNLDDEIESYEKDLSKMYKPERDKWGEIVLNQLKEVGDLENDEFIFLTGKNYWEYLINI